MNSWANDFSGMPNQFGMPMNHMMSMMANPMMGMLQDMPLGSMQTMSGGSMPPLSAPNPSENAPLIGPVAPEGFVPGKGNTESTEKGSNSILQQDKHQKGSNRNDNRRERDIRDRDRSRKRSRSPRDRNDRSGNRNSRDDRGRRDRRTKWDNNDGNPGVSQSMTPGMNMTPGMAPAINPGMGNMMLAGLMSFNNNMIGHGPMDMQNANMQHMGNMGPIHNMVPGMMPGMNMVPGMMDPNMIVMQQMQQNMALSNQPIYVADVVLLPPLPGVSTPKRREKPGGCRTIFIGGLPNGIKEDIIKELFQRFGHIVGVKLHKKGVCHVQYESHESVEESFLMSGWRFKYSDQMDNEATTLFIDYALNHEDHAEYERNRRRREATPPRVEMFSPAALTAVSEKIKTDDQFAEVAYTLAVWLERGECNKRNSNTFYSLIQASNNQTRRLFNEKMTLDEDIDKMKTQLRGKFSHIILQFEHISKILTAARHQRVSDHFTKQQRRNIEMWLKMTEEVENMKEEFNSLFDDEESEKPGRNAVPLEKYEQLKAENENLVIEMESYKNEAYLAKDEAERKFEKFKAHYIAQNALHGNNKQHNQYPPLPPPPMPSLMMTPSSSQQPKPSPLPDGDQMTSGYSVSPSEAKLISILTAFLLVHPLGATLDYLFNYIRSMMPNVTRSTVQDILRRHTDVYRSVKSPMSPEPKWTFVTFDIIKKE
ncbi:ecto-NOX disulfide-thiol exchanger 2-like [Plodia interpunctella]|uniref:ecto-NOX disulfide-thiol exchanger 2-like n=1 Tax=Plodia interpunctella TaxID=58824 RepID=UPI0023677CD4|nr:ecto-NOX disulfide-thiol exchanger 2-like [Plodia interpunctella]